MELVINTFGSSLHVKDGLFHVATKEKKLEITPEKVDRILITNAVSLSSDVILLAIENNIDIIFFNKYGDPQGRVWYSRPGSTITIKRNQLALSCRKDGLKLAKEWTKKKMENQGNFLDELSKTRKGEKKSVCLDKKEIIEGVIKQLDESDNSDIDALRKIYMGYEGSSGKAYFSALSSIMPSHYVFKGRSRRPAKDYFNAFLNYGYGVLYSIIEKYILIAGLDPYIGFLHADNYNKRSLVFDLIEPYRIIVDKTVVFLFTGKKVKKECCREVKGGCFLEKPGKDLLIHSLNKNLDTVVHYRGKNRKIRDTIQLEFHHIAQKILKENV
jgi:CRISP-associated protein Cas1